MAIFAHPSTAAKLTTLGKSVGENNRSIWTEKYFTFEGRNLAHYHSDGTYFMHQGRIGTTAQVTDYTGAVAQDELHYPWGQQWQLAGSQVEERPARLGLRDAETSFDPTRYRMYASNQGRWLSPAPVLGCVMHPENFNRYSLPADSEFRCLELTGKALYNRAL